VPSSDIERVITALTPALLYGPGSVIHALSELPNTVKVIISKAPATSTNAFAIVTWFVCTFFAVLRPVRVEFYHYHNKMALFTNVTKTQHNTKYLQTVYFI